MVPLASRTVRATDLLVVPLTFFAIFPFPLVLFTSKTVPHRSRLSGAILHRGCRTERLPGAPCGAAAKPQLEAARAERLVRAEMEAARVR